MSQIIDCAVCLVFRRTPSRHVVLAIHKPNGSDVYWAVPHGRVNAAGGENLYDAAVRMVGRAHGMLFAQDCNVCDSGMEPIASTDSDVTFMYHPYYAELYEDKGSSLPFNQKYTKGSQWIPANTADELESGLGYFQPELAKTVLRIWESFHHTRASWFS